MKVRWELTVALALGMVLGAGMVLLMNGAWAAKPPRPAKPQVAEVLRARRFEVVDGKGQMRARLALSEDGDPGLTLWGKEDQARISLRVAGSDSSLNLHDSTGRRSIMIDQADDRVGLLLSDLTSGTALVLFPQGFRLSDGKGKERAGLWLRSDGSPSLELSDATGKGRAGLTVLRDGNPFLGLSDADGKTRAAFFLMGHGNPSLDLWDAGEKERAGLNLMADGSPVLDLHDAGGKHRAALGVTELETTRTGETTRTAESALTLFDREGKVLWKAP